ncbi:MAG: DUF1211 domain-containing protein [Gammaproteobacteria bacterium]|jgi:uncharacterized membrane protein|nr:DUF1211 domain-containing protein [Gammaproteobacteria bacterium]
MAENGGERLRRSRAVTRLDTFTDAAFAFAVTMLAISIDEIPGTYAELLVALKGAPAFILSFAMLLIYWRAHQNWSERYGLDDLPSVLLTAALIVMVMIYVYPLKIMFGAAMGAISNGWLPSNFDIETVGQFRSVTSIFSVGFASLSAIIAALYLHAWRLRDDLGMSRAEAFDTAAESLAWAIVAAWAVLSIILAWTLNANWLPLAIWMYCALAVFGPAFDYCQRRIARKRFG